MFQRYGAARKAIGDRAPHIALSPESSRSSHPRNFPPCGAPSRKSDIARGVRFTNEPTHRVKESGWSNLPGRDLRHSLNPKVGGILKWRHTRTGHGTARRSAKKERMASCLQWIVGPMGEFFP